MLLSLVVGGKPRRRSENFLLQASGEHVIPGCEFETGGALSLSIHELTLLLGNIM